MADNFTAQLVNDFIAEDECVYMRPTEIGKDNQARIMSKYMNYLWSKKFGRINFIEEVIRSLVIDGMVIVKTGWKYDFDVEEKEYQVPIEQYNEWIQQYPEPEYTIESKDVTEDNMIPVVVTRYIIKEDMFDAVVKNIKDMRWDVSATSPQDMRWIGEKMSMTISDIRKQDIEYNKKSQLQLENVDKWIEKLYHESKDDANGYQTTADWKSTDYTHVIDDYANKHARKAFDIYRWIGEYDLDGDGMTEMVEAIFTDNYLLAVRPYEGVDGIKFPYIFGYFIKHNREPGGEGMMTSLEDAQKNTIAWWLMLMDYASRVVIGNKVVNVNQVYDPFEIRKIEENLPGTIHKVQGDSRTAITPLQMSPFPYGVENMFQLTQLEEQKTSRVADNTAGVFNSPGSAKTATAAAIAAQGLNNFSQFIFTKTSDTVFKELFRQWLCYINHYVDFNQNLVFADVVGENDLMSYTAGEFIDRYDVDVNFNSRGMAELEIQQINTLIMNSETAINVGAISPDELALLYRRMFTLFGEKAIAQRVSQRLEVKDDDEFRQMVAQETEKAVQQFMQSPEIQKEIQSQAKELAKIEGEYEAQRRFKQYVDTLVPEEDLNVVQ